MTDLSLDLHPADDGPRQHEPLAKGVSPFRHSLRRFCSNRLAVISLVVLCLITLACYIAPWFFPFGPEDADFENLSAPIDFTSAHLFGTDDLGRDLLIRVLDGGQVSLGLAFFGAIVSVAISVVYGATAGYLGGRIDQFMMRAVDILLSLPYVMLVIVINVVLGRSNFSLFIAVVVALWLTPAVIARGQAVSLRHREFIEAARAGGMSNWQIISQHIAPNSLNVVIVYSSRLMPAGAPSLMTAPSRSRPIFACCCCRAFSWRPYSSALTTLPMACATPSTPMKDRRRG
jgi:oligopeptide transport system permease protein